MSFSQGHGIWSIEFLIDSVQKSDTEKEYVLEAINDLGTERYKIVLSSATEPAGRFLLLFCFRILYLTYVEPM